jgi:hypothetical protein
MTNELQAEMRALTAELRADIERFRVELVRYILLAMIANGMLNGVCRCGIERLVEPRLKAQR